jgi:hypothetical protein
MRKIAKEQLSFNSTPLGEAADRREFDQLSYPAKKLVRRYRLHPRDARLRARFIGWNID